MVPDIKLTEEDIEISLSSPKIYEYLTDEAKKHYEDLKRSLNILEIDFEENANLVRDRGQMRWLL